MIKKGDFIELDYTAKIKDDKLVFDTTLAEVAKASDSYNPKFKYEPVVICVGEHHLIPGLDDALEGKELGKFTIEIPAEKGFGKKSASLLKLIPLKLFKQDKVDPFPGLEVNVDGQVGIVKSVSGGRVIVDFNHPLSGRDLAYDVELKRVVTDPAEQVRAILELIHLHHHGIDIVEGKAKISVHDKLPEDVAKGIAEDIKRVTHLKHVEFALDESKKHEHAPKNEAKAAAEEGKKEAKPQHEGKPKEDKQ